MASSGTKVAPESLESSISAMGGIQISVFSEECEGGGYGAWSSTPSEEHSQTAASLSAKAAAAAPKESSLPWGSIDPNTSSPSSCSTSQKGKLPMVLEESESLSHREGSSVWDASSSSKFSNASSSASSTRAFFCSYADEDRKRRKKPHGLREVGRGRGEASLVSVLLWPLKKVRDGYMSCMMGLDGAGDLSGLAQGSMYGTSTKYFADLPLSKTDFRNHG